MSTITAENRKLNEYVLALVEEQEMMFAAQDDDLPLGDRTFAKYADPIPEFTWDIVTPGRSECSDCPPAVNVEVQELSAMDDEDLPLGDRTFTDYSHRGNIMTPEMSEDSGSLPIVNVQDVKVIPGIDAQGRCREARRSHRTEKLKNVNIHSRSSSRKSNMKASRVKKALERTLEVPCELSDLRCSTLTSLEQRAYSMDELEGLGIKIIEWDGMDSIPIQTSSGLVVGLLAGRPEPLSWDYDMQKLATQMEKERKNITFPKHQMEHRRGDYPTIATGLSYGGGAVQPGELRLGSQKTQNAVQRLRDLPELARLGDYVTSAFRTFAPLLWTFCDAALTRLEEQNPHLTRPIKKSGFSTITFNFPPRAFAKPHRDFKNLAWGWCAVTSFGTFDYRKGGHLILWEFKVAVQFPPHSTILIPSAILEHASTSIQPGETRSNITQYCSAGIFRWIAYGFMPKGVAVAKKREPASWWKKPTQMFTKMPNK